VKPEQDASTSGTRDNALSNETRDDDLEGAVSTINEADDAAAPVPGVGDYHLSPDPSGGSCGHQQALRLREMILGKEYPSTLGSMSNLVLVLSRQS
jgi:hypothetical protein